MDTFSWIMAIVGGSLIIVVVLAAIWLVRRPARVEPLPTDWALTARPVFSTDERRVHRLLREALPNHVVLAKLPLVRFCQPLDPEDVRYWFNLLSSTHVTFAVCSLNGRVLAAVDLDRDRANSRRMLQIKQSVLGACRVRYLRCAIDNLPTPAELQLLVPSGIVRAEGAAGLDEARDSLSGTVANRRAQRSARWQDSSNFNDSFFALDSRLDSLGQSEYGTLSTELTSRLDAVPALDDRPRPHRSDAALASDATPASDDIAGVVVDTPPPLASRS